MGAALSGCSRGYRPAARVGRRVGADRRRCQGVTCPMNPIPAANLPMAGGHPCPPRACRGRAALMGCCTLLLLQSVVLTAAAAPPGPHATAPARHAVADDHDASHLPAGRFGTVAVYIPDGKPQSVAIFISGDGGWELGVINMARALTSMGAVVIGVDVRHYFDSLHKAALRPGAPCQMIAADFEALSH